jgi:hypothetical protein
LLKHFLRAVEHYPPGTTLDDAQLVEEVPGMYEGYVDASLLRVNMDAYQILARKVRDTSAEVIIAPQRGGAFLSDVLEQIDPTFFSSRIVRPAKILPKKDMWGHLCDQLVAMVEKGERRICIVDTYMSGFSASDIVRHVFVALLQRCTTCVDLQLHSVKEVYRIPLYLST